MAFVSTEDTLMALLRAESAPSPNSGCSLSKAVETVTGDVGRLSHHVAVGSAAESLAGRGLLRQETTDGGRIFLELTDTGRERANDAYTRLAATDIELVDDAGHRRLSIETAATELDRSIPEVAAACSEDGVVYRHETPPTTELVDREAEQTTWQTLIDRCRRERSGEVLFLVGPSGIGKSTLAEAMLESVGGAVDVVRAHCQTTSNEPYQPIRDLISDIDAESDPFEAIGPDPVGVVTDRPEEADVYQAQQTGLFHDVTERLAPGNQDDVSLRVLFLDDMYRADGATVAYLNYLFERLPGLRLAVLATHLPGEFTDQEPDIDGIPEGTPVTTIDLEDFDRDDTGRLIEQVVNHRGVPDDFAHAIHERTGGTPLFVEAAVQSLLERNQLDPQFRWYPDRPSDIEVPDHVQEILSKRADMIGEIGREVLEWTAVAGDPVPVSLLQAVCDQPPQQVAGTIEVLVEADVMDRQATTQTVSLRSITREVLLEDIDGAERRHRHAEVARHLERTAGDAPESLEARERAGQIAYHLDRAGEVATAIDWYRTAAERATDVYAHETAIEHYHRILDIATTAENTDATLAAAEALAEIYTTIGEYDNASRYVQFVGERVGGETTLRRQRVARLEARIAIDRGAYDDAEQAATRGLAHDERETREQCRLFGLLATAQLERSMYEDARETARRQRSVAATIGARDLESAAIRRLGMIARHQGDHEQARGYLQESLAIATELDDRRSEAVIRKELGTVNYEQGRYEEAGEYYQESYNIVCDLDIRKLESDCLNNLGIVQYKQGQYDRAVEYYDQSLEITRDIGDQHVEAYNLLNLGAIAKNRGRFDWARDHYERCIDICRDIGDQRAEARALYNLGIVVRQLGDFEQSRMHFSRGLEIARDIGDRDGEASSLSGLGVTAQQQGDYDRATEYHKEGLDIARDIGSRQTANSLVTNIGIIARRQGDLEQAREYLQKSLDRSREIGIPTTEITCLLELGGIACQSGDFERARECFQNAREIATEMDIPANKIDAFRGLSAVARISENLEKARTYLQEALDLTEDIKDPLRRARVELERARLALVEDDLETANEQIEAAQETFERLEVTHRYGRSVVVQGRIAAARGARDTAREYWHEALKTFESVWAPHDALDTIRYLVDTCRERGNEDGAQSWIGRAQDILADAPASVRANHEDWVERIRTDIDDP